MREAVRERINRETADLPERWGEVLKDSLIKGDFSTEAEFLLKSAVAAHTAYPPQMDAAESILAGDAFIPMAIESMLENNRSLEEIERFLSEAVELINK